MIKKGGMSDEWMFSGSQKDQSDIASFGTDYMYSSLSNK